MKLIKGRKDKSIVLIDEILKLNPDTTIILDSIIIEFPPEYTVVRTYYQNIQNVLDNFTTSSYLKNVVISMNLSEFQLKKIKHLESKCFIFFN